MVEKTNRETCREFLNLMFDGVIKWGDSVEFPGTFNEIKVSHFLSQICQRSNK
jgi:hypothetical protein